MAYNPNANIVVSGKTFENVPSVQFKTPDGAMVNFAHVGGQIRFSPTLEEQTHNVANYQDVIIDPVTSTLLNQLDSDFVAKNIKKGVDLFGLMGTMESGSAEKIVIGSIKPTADITSLDITHNMGSIPKAYLFFSLEPYYNSQIIFSYAVNASQTARSYKFINSVPGSAGNIAYTQFTYANATEKVKFNSAIPKYNRGMVFKSFTTTTCKLDTTIASLDSELVKDKTYIYMFFNTEAYNSYLSNIIK